MFKDQDIKIDQEVTSSPQLFDQDAAEPTESPESIFPAPYEINNNHQKKTSAALDENLNNALNGNALDERETLARDYSIIAFNNALLSKFEN